MKWGFASWHKNISGALPRGRYGRAFTLIELLVVLSIIAILASLLLPALSRAKAKGQSAVCQGNLKQLTLGWMLYAHDNDDRLAGSVSLDWVNQPGSWVLGNAKQDRTASNVMTGVMFAYAPAIAAYRCPADRSTVEGENGLLRTRSYTLNSWMNSSMTYPNGDSWGPKDFTSMPQKLSQIVRPPPAGTLVLIDEHELSIDDGLWNSPPFALAAPGVPVLRPGESPMWHNLPTDRHNQGGNIAFADGHVQPHKWLWPKRNWDPISHQVGPANEADTQDLIWLLTLCPVEPVEP